MSDCRSNARPRCPKCAGLLIPEFELNGRVTAVKCIACGEYIDRHHKRRRADVLESNIRVAPHKCARRDVGPGRSNYQAGVHRGVER